jgi:hypothetical protein
LGPKLGNTSYVECENTFHTWATVHASDPLQAGTVRDADAYRDVRVYDEINNYRPIQGASYVAGYDAVLNYLNNYLAIKGWPEAPPFASGVLSNPRDWVTAARATLTLEREWPEYARRIAASRLAEIAGVGQKLQAGLNGLATDAADGSRDNQRFYGRLVDNYMAKATAVNDILPTIIDEYKDELRGHQQLSGNVDFWAGADQDTGYQRTIGPLGRCADGRDYDLLWPGNLWSRVPRYYLLAEQLKLGNIEVICDYGPVHADQRTYYDECRWFYNWNKLYITLTMRFRGESILRWAYISPEFLAHFNAGGHYCFGRPYPNPAWFTLYPYDTDRPGTLRTNWSQDFNIRGWMESTAPQVLNPTFDTAIRSAVDAKLREHQDAVVRRIRDDLAPGGRHYATTGELAGAKALLDAFVHLGLPRAYETDELLSALIAGDARADVCTEVVVDPTTGRTEWRVPAANRLIDEALLHALLDCAVANSISRPDLRLVMERRAETLRTTINKYLALIDDGVYQEGHYAIDATLRALSVRRQLKRFPPQGAIAGLAFRDDNRNGQQDRGEPDTAGVTLFLDTDGNGQVDQGEWFNDRNGNNWPDDEEPFDDRNYNWRRDAGEHWATTTADGRFTFGKELAGFRSICGVPPTGYVVIGPRCKQALVTFNATTTVPFGLAPPLRIMLPIVSR